MVTMTLRPCPFCGVSPADHDIVSGETEAVVRCESCFAEGPLATLGCRGDEDGDIDLEAEAVELWNQRKLGVVAP
jgi:hypothetical protein